jgi:hypothetical protein
MGFFGMLFWFAVIWLAFRAFRGWTSCGARVMEHHGVEQSDTDHQSYIEALESRVAELEERLDFTERLVAGRREVVSQG